MTSFGFCGDGISFSLNLITNIRKYESPKYLVVGISFSFTLITNIVSQSVSQLFHGPAPRSYENISSNC